MMVIATPKHDNLQPSKRSYGQRVSPMPAAHNAERSVFAISHLTEVTPHLDRLDFSNSSLRFQSFCLNGLRFSTTGRRFNTRLQIPHQDPNILHAV
jgi:hypothetical protein